MKELKILVCNVHGIRQHREQEDRMVEVVEEAKRQKRQIVVLTETHFDVDDSSRFAEIAEKSGFATFSVTRVMKRVDSGSGGVTIGGLEHQSERSEEEQTRGLDLGVP